MQKYFLRLIILLLLALGLIACSHHSTRFHDSRGNVIDFAKLHGEWVVINYWATWCHSCVQEIPELNAFYQKQNAQKVIVIGVNYDDLPNPQLTNAIKEFHIAYPVLLGDPNQALGLGQVTVVPTTFILNPQGKVVQRLVGPQTYKKLQKLIDMGG